MDFLSNVFLLPSQQCEKYGSITLSPWAIEDAFSSPSYTHDIGTADGITPQQLRIYLSALSLEPQINTIEMDSVTNIVKHIVINQLSLD